VARQTGVVEKLLYRSELGVETGEVCTTRDRPSVRVQTVREGVQAGERPTTGGVRRVGREPVADTLEAKDDLIEPRGIDHVVGSRLVIMDRRHVCHRSPMVADVARSDQRDALEVCCRWW
jgi:hypothetical protein